MQAMEAAMLDAPGNWRHHYHGTLAEQRLMRHYSLSAAFANIARAVLRMLPSQD